MAVTGIKNTIIQHKRELKDVFYLVGLQGLNYIAPLFVLPYLIVVLGPDSFGCIGFALSVCQYLMLIVDFGFNLSATKRIALAKGNQDELNKIFSATVYAKLLLIAVAFFIMLVVAFIPQFAVYQSTLFAMFPMVIGNALLFIFLFQGMGEIRWISIVNAIAKFSILPLNFILVTSASDYLTAAFLQGLVAVVAALISLVFIWHKKWVKLISFNRSEILKETKESFPLFLSTAATSVYVAAFVIILAYFTSPEEVGRYSAVDRVMRAACYALLIPVLQAFYPRISALIKEDKQEAFNLVRKLFVLVIAGMSVVALFLFFGSSYAEQFMGDGYKGTEKLFKMIAFVPLFVGMGGVIGQLGMLAMGDKKDKKNFTKVYFMAAVVALIAVFALIPILHAEGAVISLFLTEFVVFVLMLYYGGKFLAKQHA